MKRAVFGVLMALAVLSPAQALTTAAATKVSDADVVRLLKAEYGERVTLTGEWPTRQAYGPDADEDRRDRSGTRAVCADDHAEFGPRLVAVCTSVDDAGHVDFGVVDLFEISDARIAGEVPHVDARERGIETGGYGSPGAVRFMDVGSARTAFALDSGYSNMGWLSQRTALYVPEEKRFRMLLDVGTELGNGGACDPETDGATCRAQQVDLTCTLRVDMKDYDGGFYGLLLDVKGRRAGKPVKRTVRIPHAGGIYSLPSKQLKRDACDEGF